MMTKETKDRIIGCARQYAQAKGMSQAALARHCGVSQSYLSNLINGNYQYKAGDKTVDIAEKYFATIADAIGCSLEQKYWEIVPTDQFVIGLSALEEAHRNATTEEGRGAYRMIIGESGCGKTTIVKQYAKAHPLNSFVVRINDYDTINDIIGEIIKQLDIEMPTWRGMRLRAVGTEFKRRAMAGEQNILIIDEGENTKLPGLKAYKAIYDMLQGYAAFVIFGTPELSDLLQTLLRRNKPGIPQFVRRFKANTVYLPAIERNYDLMLRPVNDPSLRKLLTAIADNYGELHDYLERSLHDAAVEGVELTEEYFRVKNNLPPKTT